MAAGTPWAEREALDAAGAAEEFILLGLRTVEGAPVAAFEALGAEARIAGLEADGFLTVVGGRVIATARGRPVLDGVLKALLA